MSPRSYRKTSNWSAIIFKTTCELDELQLEPVIWPRDTGQRIPCFDSCQLIVALMSNIKKVDSEPRLFVSGNLFRSMAAMLQNSVAVVVAFVVRTRPRAIPLAMIIMRKLTHGFPFLSHDEYGAPLGSPSGRRSSTININIWFVMLVEHSALNGVMVMLLLH